MKKDRVKKQFLSELERQPIIQYACERCDISRNSYYRWYREDAEFAAQVEAHRGIGIDLVNDICESNLLKGIQNGIFSYIKFWLEHHHQTYKNTLNSNSSADTSEARERERRAIEAAKKEIDGWEKMWSNKHKDPPAPPKKKRRKKKP